jgi:DNA-directed RNA polymerase subunit beta'
LTVFVFFLLIITQTVITKKVQLSANLLAFFRDIYHVNINMPYPVIPSNLKNIESVYLKLLSGDEMLEMSYGQVLTPETINYRTGVPQPNGLFCQAIFGPTKDYECACGKYKRFRYEGVTCDKCGVTVAPTRVRRERMGHIDLACPVVHPWMLRIIPSRISTLLEMKSTDLSKICYFAAYVVTYINEELRTEYLGRIDSEGENRIKSTKANFDQKFENIGKQYQIDKSGGKFDIDELKARYETEKELLKTHQQEILTKIETIAQVAKKELMNIKIKDVITENIYQELASKFGPVFRAEIGAEAIKTLLDAVDLEEDLKDVKERMLTAKAQGQKKLSQKLKLIKHFINNNTKPAWMILDRIMVLPPDLRPMLQLDGGRFAASDLNDLYRRVISRNNRLRKLIVISAPEVILRNEKRMLQEAVEALIDNGARNGKQVMASSGAKRPLKSLTDSLKGKGGRFRQNLLGKRVDYSGRSVIIVGPTLKLNECGVSKEMALELFKPFIIGRVISKSEKGLLSEEFQCFNVHSARRLIESKKPVIYDILEEVIADKYVLLNRAPTLHRLGFLAFKPVLTEGKAIQIHPMVCRGFNADFDGDTMGIHLPITLKGQEEARDLMTAGTNLLKPANGKLIMGGAQDIHLGAYYITMIFEDQVANKTPRIFANTAQAMSAYQMGAIKINEKILVRLTANPREKAVETSIGRVIFNQCLPEKYGFINKTVVKSNYDKILGNIFHELGQEQLAETLDKVKDVLFKYVTASGISISIADFERPQEKYALIGKAEESVTKIQQAYELGLLSADGKHDAIVELWRNTGSEVGEMVKAKITPTGNVGMMIDSGARGTVSQVNFIAGMRGLTVASNGKEIELPTVNSYLDGASPLEYFVMMYGHRKGLAGTALQTADSGYLTRRLVDVAQDLIVMSEDCKTTDGLLINKVNSANLKLTILDRIYGRYLAADLVVDGKVLASAGDLMDAAKIEELKTVDIEFVNVRAITKCAMSRGVCIKCYGFDLSTHKPVNLGTAVGVIGAQSIGEQATQLTVGQQKHGLAIGAKADITQGLPRVEELFEARTPKYTTPIAGFDGIVNSISGSIEQGFKVSIAPITKGQFLLTTANSSAITTVDEGSHVNKGDVVAVTSEGEVISSDVEGNIKFDGKNLIIENPGKVVEEYETLPGYYINVKKGDRISKTHRLSEGPADLQKVVAVGGIDALHYYVLSELNEIYITNGIDVNEKHIEIIIRQMCSRAQIVHPGDSDFVPGDIVRLSVIKAMNDELIANGQDKITYKYVITGISRASLSTNSFLSAASFQETSRVLVEAALSSRKDYLVGLKENVILGQLVPCGTGFDYDKVAQLEDDSTEFTAEELDAMVVED